MARILSLKVMESRVCSASASLHEAFRRQVKQHWLWACGASLPRRWRAGGESCRPIRVEIERVVAQG